MMERKRVKLYLYFGERTAWSWLLSKRVVQEIEAGSTFG